MSGSKAAAQCWGTLRFYRPVSPRGLIYPGFPRQQGGRDAPACCAASVLTSSISNEGVRSKLSQEAESHSFSPLPRQLLASPKVSEGPGEAGGRRELAPQTRQLICSKVVAGKEMLKEIHLYIGRGFPKRPQSLLQGYGHPQPSPGVMSGRGDQAAPEISGGFMNHK